MDRLYLIAKTGPKINELLALCGFLKELNGPRNYPAASSGASDTLSL
jgi:hypothetical protein